MCGEPSACSTNDQDIETSLQSALWLVNGLRHVPARPCCCNRDEPGKAHATLGTALDPQKCPIAYEPTRHVPHVADQCGKNVIRKKSHRHGDARRVVDLEHEGQGVGWQVRGRLLLPRVADRRLESRGVGTVRRHAQVQARACELELARSRPVKLYVCRADTAADSAASGDGAHGLFAQISWNGMAGTHGSGPMLSRGQLAFVRAAADQFVGGHPRKRGRPSVC